MIGVPLRAIIDAARGRQIIFPGELAGYIVLGALDASRTLGASTALDEIRLGDDGRVVIGAHKSDLVSGPLEYRRILSDLLEVASLPSPALRHAASSAGSPGTFSTDLQTALVPVNRAAARRRLARLYRELVKLNLTVDDAPAAALAPSIQQPVGPSGSDASRSDRVEERAPDVSHANLEDKGDDDGSLALVPPVAPCDQAWSSAAHSLSRSLTISVLDSGAAEGEGSEIRFAGGIPDLEIPELLLRRDPSRGSAAGDGLIDLSDAQTPRIVRVVAVEHTQILSTKPGDLTIHPDSQAIAKRDLRDGLLAEASSGRTMPLALPRRGEQENVTAVAVSVEHTQRLAICPSMPLLRPPDHRSSTPDDGCVVAAPEPSIVLPLLRRRTKPDSCVPTRRDAASRDDETSIDAIVEVSEDEIEYLLGDSEPASLGESERLPTGESEVASFDLCETASQGENKPPSVDESDLTSHGDIELHSVSDGELAPHSENGFASIATECLGCDASSTFDTDDQLIDADIADWTADRDWLPIEAESAEPIDISLSHGFGRPSLDFRPPPPPPPVVTLYRSSPSGTVRRSDIAELSPQLLEHSNWTEAALCEDLRAVAGLQN